MVDFLRFSCRDRKPWPWMVGFSSVFMYLAGKKTMTMDGCFLTVLMSDHEWLIFYGIHVGEYTMTMDG